jgi:hypothetical protein
MADSNKKNLAPRLRPRAERLRSQSCIPFSPAGAARAAATIRRVNRCIARIRKYEKKLSEFLFAFRFPMIRSQAASTRFTGQHWLPWIACPGLDPRAAITSCLLPCAARRVSSKRAVMVTVSLSSPASIGVGAAAPAVYAREKATGGWRPASSVSTMSRPILAPPATLQGALRWRLQLGASGVTRAIRSSDPSASPQSADRPQNSSGRIRSDRAEILGLRRRRCRSPNSPRQSRVAAEFRRRPRKSERRCRRRLASAPTNSAGVPRRPRAPSRRTSGRARIRPDVARRPRRH